MKNLGYKTKIYIRNNKLTTKDVIDDPHLTIGKYWTLYNVEKFLDCCSSPSPDLLTKYFIKGNENFFQTRKTKKKTVFVLLLDVISIFIRNNEDGFQLLYYICIELNNVKTKSRNR